MPRSLADRPIGMFDSGVGGLTIANALVRRLPNESLIYFGDTAHMPYGEKSPDAIRYYSLKIANFLARQRCKLVVVACNSAASAAYNVLLEFYEGQTLFLNVVDPLIATVAQHGFRKVGVIATKMTINSGVYERKLRELQPHLEVVSMATPLLAPMVEEGLLNNAVSRATLENYLLQPQFEGIEALLLACTHYPLLRNDIAAILPNVQIFDSCAPTAAAAHQLLEQNWLLNTDPPEPHRFLVSDYTPAFENTAQLFFGSDIALTHRDIWMGTGL